MEKNDTVNENKKFGMHIEPLVMGDDVDLTIHMSTFNQKYFDVDDIFSDIKDYETFKKYNKVTTNYDLPVKDYSYYSHKTVISTHLSENNKQEVLIKDQSYCTHEIKFNELEKRDFLAKPLELFNEKSIVKKYDEIMENPKGQDIVNMLIDEKVIDSEKYNKLREKKKEQDFINAVSSVTNKEQDQGLEM